MNKEQLLEKARLLPLTPGVYLMHAKNGSVIYVGKSKALHNRVSSYFVPYAKHNPKTKRMVASVDDFEVYHTKTELEALILENQFIKQYMPRYNIKLKDSKSYPYLVVTRGDWPTLKVTYDRKDDGARYYGPFSSASVAYGILGAAKKAFHLPTCTRIFPRDIGKARPCLNYHIGQCIAPCLPSRVTPEDFRAVYDAADGFLRGNYTGVVKDLTARMEEASEAMAFEQAARFRDAIRAVEKIGDKQHIVGPPDMIADIAGLYTDDLGSALILLFVRGGVISDRESFFFSSDEIVSSGALTSFLFRYYTLRGFIPKELYLGFSLEPEDKALLAEKLSEEHAVRITIPQKGEKKALTEQACNNARELLLHKREEESRTDRFLASLTQFLSLEVVPERMEAYDVSNSGDQYITCAMIVIENGVFVKRAYRSFNIHTVDGQDDYSAMREALGRRFDHTGAGWDWPDLVLLDGGNQHVSVIRGLFTERGIDIPVLGMVKDEHHKTRTVTDGEHELSLNARQDIFNFFYKIQEEVHRFTFGKMDAKRRKAVRTSALTAVPGVGEATAARLQKHFGSYKKICAASVEELAAVPGVSRRAAQAVADYYQSRSDGKEKDKSL